ncbi:hypothetical protein HNR19_003649 [Nocardioides thalensis]|uniref:DUF4383 domain-containing protein n=1 Tax=Nocardioides thalensis TaxID=1914755 RepID=A0A853C731_9ACTN|nr:hypothetical protein [Nocardioides thalensis]NYJ02951.1 hypothetical protein [Nocardioides thalensis]
MRRAVTPAALVAFGASYVVLGAWAGVHAASFTEAVADFGPPNDHLVHDYGAASVAVGGGLLLAVRRPGWWLPVLAVAAIWNALHTVSHLVGIDQAGSRALGVAEAVVLFASTVLLAGLATMAREEP